MKLETEIEQLEAEISASSTLSYNQAERIAELNAKLAVLPVSERGRLQEKLWKPLERFGVYRAAS